VFHVSAENKCFAFHPLGNTATSLQYWDEDAYANELIVSMPKEEKLAKVGESRVKTVADLAAEAAEKEGLLAAGKEADAKTKKRKNEVKDTAKQKKVRSISSARRTWLTLQIVPAHLQFWSNRHAELHGGQPPTSTNLAGKKMADGKSDDTAAATEHGPPTRSFADLHKKCCYLCSRQFKTEAEVNKHERISQLHRDNLANDDLVSKALAKIAKLGIAAPKPEEDTPEYRDRARERRIAYGSSKKTSLPPKASGSGAAREPDEAEQAPAPSKGAALLSKMGWVAGEGLGADGKGVTAPIATELYAAGVGLGAQGGKIGDAVVEAQRNTKGGYEEFLDRTRDKAKERFESMG
jgi:hypothetical protein